MGTRQPGSGLGTFDPWITARTSSIINNARSTDVKSLMIMAARLQDTKPFMDDSFQIPYAEVRLHYVAATLMHGVRV